MTQHKKGHDYVLVWQLSGNAESVDCMHMMADEIERLRAVIRPESYARSDEKRVLYDTKSPRNGALSGCETVPDPDSRVWETPFAPQTHATQPQGSVQGEGSVPDSRNAKEPVAWAVETGGELEASFCGPAGREDAADWREQSDGVIVPLCRHPQPTLTAQEWGAVAAAIAEAESHFHARRADTLRKLLERLS